jgi:hypothetical protein
MKAACSFCSQNYSIQSSDVGSTLSCSNCGEDFVVTAMLEGSGGQAVGSASTHPESRVSLTDKFFSIIFKLIKPLSAVFAIIFIIVLSLSLFSLTMTLFGNSVKTPTYSSLTTGKEAKKNGLADLDSSREVEEEYGDQINDLIKNHFSDDSVDAKKIYEFLKENVTDVSDDYRAQFLDGFEDVLDEAEEKGKDVEEKLSLTDSYRKQFSGNIVEAEAAESEASMARMGLIALSFGSSFGLFAVLLLPAILRIERNLD